MKRYLLLGLCLLSSSLMAWDCRYEKDIEDTLDLAGAESLSVRAGAGELEIRGDANASGATIRGRICVSKEKWLDGAGVETSGGRHAEIVVQLPDTAGWSLTGNTYARLDLELVVPEGLPLDVKDSSGDLDIRDVDDLVLQDSSGEIELENIGRSVTIRDSSGDISLRDVRGDVTIDSDSSGDIRGERITGSVLVKNDSSGDIRFEDVGGDFVVEKDSSGDITASDVGGDFRVLRDGSGRVVASRVEGEVVIPDN